MTELPAELFAAWPQRFRFRQLLISLAEPGALDPSATANAVLTGLIAGQDESAVFEEFVSEGKFDLAETVYDECPTLAGRHSDKLLDHISKERSNRLQQLASLLQDLEDMAENAGLPLGEIDGESLERRSGQNWPDVVVTLAAHRAALHERIRLRAAHLSNTLAAANIDAASAEICRAMLEFGYLRAAERLLESGGEDIAPGPESMGQLQTWPWRETPREVLRWHTHTPYRQPTGFDRWHPVDETGKRLLNALQDLFDGIGGASRDVAVALDRFLGAEPDAHVEVHEVPGGSLAKLHNLFGHPPIQNLHPTGAVELFVSEPGVTQIPAELASMDPFIALGPNLVRRASPERGQVAVLGLDDLLRIVPLRQYRAVSVLRFCAPQWPLTALSAGTAEQLRNLLEAHDSGARWRTVSWLMYLGGLGDAHSADALAFQTGLDAGLLDVILNHLVQTRLRQPNCAPAEVIRQWLRDAHTAAMAEAAVLEQLRHSPAAIVAFWAALSIAPPGEPVSIDEIAIAIELATDVKLDAELRAGLNEVGGLWLVADQSATEMRFRRCGALIALHADAEARLADAAHAMAARMAEPRAQPRLTAWTRHRYRLCPALPEYLELIDAPAEDAAAVAALGKVMNTQRSDLLRSNPEAVGTADVVAVLRAMREHFAEDYPGLALAIEAPSSAVVAVRPEFVEVLVYELVQNAAEELRDAGEGTISISIRSVPGDVILSVRDSGAGIAADATYRIFRQDGSTRGTGRGQGLYLARRLAQSVGGDLDLAMAAANHPILRGAHFRLILPSR